MTAAPVGVEVFWLQNLAAPPGQGRRSHFQATFRAATFRYQSSGILFCVYPARLAAEIPRGSPSSELSISGGRNTCANRQAREGAVAGQMNRIGRGSAGCVAS